MTTELVIQIGREMLYTALLLSLPTVAASLIVGLAISVLANHFEHSRTDIDVCALHHRGRLVLVLTMPWTLQVLVQFTSACFGSSRKPLDESA